MRLSGWTAPGGAEELAVCSGPEGTGCLLVLPAWFDEGNKLRHFTVEAMRALARRGVASVLPDLPGCNESLAPLAEQDLDTWRAAAFEAAQQLGCTHVLAIRAAAGIAPPLPGWAYAPVPGRSALRSLLRARVIGAKEAGRSETAETLLEQGMAGGLDLAGYRIGAAMIRDLAAAEEVSPSLSLIAAADLGGPGLWLRAEADHDPAQAEALAALVAGSLAR